jgi:hypothetical protein
MPGFMDNLINQAEKTARAAKEAVTDAAEDFVEDTTQGLADAEKAFNERGVAAGVAETVDALSAGTAAANALDALGVVPEDPFTKNIIAAAFYGPLSPLGLKNFSDALRNLENAPKGVKGSVQAAHAFACESPRAVYAMLRGPKAGWLRIKIPGGGMPPLPGPGRLKDLPIIKNRLTDRINRGLGNKLKEKGIERTGTSCREKNLGERTIDDILNDPSLAFEDMVAMVMALVMKELQDEVKEKLKALKGAKAAGDDKGSAAAGDDAQAAVKAGKGGVGGKGSGSTAIDPFAEVMNIGIQTSLGAVGGGVTGATGGLIPADLGGAISGLGGGGDLVGVVGSLR